ncbi:MAG: hypothetical protein AB7J35_10710 [Dehalococcoidia bacterium]
MRIGELDDAVGKEFIARRGNMLAEAAKLPAKLAEPPSGATAPAVAMPDTVHISPEARAAQFGPLPASTNLGILPPPGEVVAAIQELATAAPGSPAAAAGVAQLVSLAVQASGVAAAALPELPPAAHEQVARLVQALLSRANQPGGAPGATDAQIQGLVRELLGALPQPQGSVGPAQVSTYERAAAVLLIGIAKQAPQDSMLIAAGRAQGDLPPALLELLAMPQPVRRRPARHRLDEELPFDFDEDERDAGEEPDGDYFTTK